jgi:hypothetical protein
MASDPGAFLERYRANLAALTTERQPEIDALTRKLARQDAAIAALRARHARSAEPVVRIDTISKEGTSMTTIARR